MKKILFYYIFREMILYFLLCFLFFFIIFFVNQILYMAEDILSKKAPLQDVAKLMVFALPSIIATSAPFSALVGTLMGFGRIVTDREIIAMNSLGIPTGIIFLPVLCAGILISAISFYTNDTLLPLGTIHYTRLYRSILTSTPALELESNSIKRNQNAVVITGSMTNDVLDSLLIIEKMNDGSRRVVAAESSVIQKSDNPNILMTLSMQEPRVISFDRKDRSRYDSIVADNLSYNILLKNIMPSYSANVSPREMSSRDVARELRKKREEGDERAINLYLMELNKKFSIPFGAFFFVILAFPLALGSKSNGQSTGFIFGLIIAVVYWALLIGGQTLSTRLNANGAIMMWIPNIAVLGMSGIVYVLRKLQ